MRACQAVLPRSGIAKTFSGVRGACYIPLPVVPSCATPDCRRLTGHGPLVHTALQEQMDIPGASGAESLDLQIIIEAGDCFIAPCISLRSFVKRHNKVGQLGTIIYVAQQFRLIAGRAYSLFMRRISCVPPLCWPDLPSPLTPDGTSFNIQNPIPHPSQKEKVLLETRRAKECQRGTVGAEERAKEGGRVLFESSDTHLGARCREFESPLLESKTAQK